MITRYKYTLQVIVLCALLASFVPVSALGAPPVDMFQFPWEQGLSWIAMDGFDNGTKRLPTSPHNYNMGGAVDFAPHVNMKVGEDTSNFWVTAAAAGTIFEISSCHMKIDHGNGWITEYWHLDKLQVAKGAAVYRNQKLAVIADNKYQQVCTGNEFPGPHLHFVMRPKMIETIFSGWTIKYNAVTNVTTFTKNGLTLGSFQPILNVPNLQIVLRDAITWDIVYTGSVDAYRYERWPFQLTETTKFTLTASPSTSGLTLVTVLLDANGNEITRASGALTSTQPAGKYFVQIQPQAGNGFYTLLMKKEVTEPTEPYVSTVIIPTSINMGETVKASVNLGNIPAGGYTSAEFTCAYNPSLVKVGNILAGSVFGADPVMAVNDPQNGTFIVAIAGSNGSRATAAGTAFTFDVTGLQAGQTAVECKARISKGDNILSGIMFIGDSLTIVGSGSTSTPTPPPPTPTPPPPSVPVLTGQVLASKPVTIRLYKADNSLAASVTANADGTFTLTTAAGTYTVTASADGFLNAQGSVTLTNGITSTKPTISLIAGDIDQNGVIDQYDAMTIGMSYNTALPAAADLNSDGQINLLDLELLARNYRKSGSLAW